MFFFLSVGGCVKQQLNQSEEGAFYNITKWFSISARCVSQRWNATRSLLKTCPGMQMTADFSVNKRTPHSGPSSVKMSRPGVLCLLCIPSTTPCFRPGLTSQWPYVIKALLQSMQPVKNDVISRFICNWWISPIINCVNFLGINTWCVSRFFLSIILIVLFNAGKLKTKAGTGPTQCFTLHWSLEKPLLQCSRSRCIFWQQKHVSPMMMMSFKIWCHDLPPGERPNSEHAAKEQKKSTSLMITIRDGLPVCNVVR